jgi:hypothetical protein
MMSVLVMNIGENLKPALVAGQNIANQLHA